METFEKSEVVQIMCFWNTNNDAFSKEGVYKSQVILYEDGWFEGITKDPLTIEKSESFIFGVYLTTKVIEGTILFSLKENKPFVFEGTKDAKGYTGHFHERGLTKPKLSGDSYVITSLEEAKDFLELEGQIKALKEKVLSNENNSAIYNHQSYFRGHLIKEVKNKFNVEETSEKYR